MNLSDDLIEKLSQAIVVTKMETIAISYLNIQSETVDNLRIAHQGNPTAFNRAVLTIWKCMTPGIDQIQVSFNVKLTKTAIRFTILTDETEEIKGFVKRWEIWLFLQQMHSAVLRGKTTTSTF